MEDSPDPREDGGIQTNTVVKERLDIIAEEDEDDVLDVDLGEMGYQRFFFSEARNKRGTFSRIVMGYSCEIPPVDANVEKPPMTILQLDITPGIFKDGQVYQMFVFIPANDSLGITPVITPVEDSQENQRYAPPTVSVLESGCSATQISPEGRQKLMQIHKDHREARSTFMAEAIEHIRKARVDASSEDGTTVDLDPEEVKKCIEEILDTPEEIWPFITQQYQIIQDDDDEPPITWASIDEEYTTLYSDTHKEYRRVKDASTHRYFYITVDFYNGDHIASSHDIASSTQHVSPTVPTKIHIPKGGEVGDHATEDDFREQAAMCIPTPHVQTYTSYWYRDVDGEDGSIRYHPYMFVSTEVWKARDSVSIHYPNITVSKTFETGEDKVSHGTLWPLSVATTIPWEDLAKSEGILTTDGLLVPREDLAKQIGTVTGNKVCLQVPSSVKYSEDPWSSKYQAWPVCNVHSALVLPRGDVKKDSPQALLDNILGKEREEEEEEEENNLGLPLGTSITIIPEHSLITMNLLEREVCTKSDVTVIHQHLEDVCHEALNRQMEYGPNNYAETIF